MAATTGQWWRRLVNAYEVKAGIYVCSVKTVWSIPEHFRSEVLTKGRYINLQPLPFTFTCCVICLLDKCHVPGIAASAAEHRINNSIRSSDSSSFHQWLKHFHGTRDLERSCSACERTSLNTDLSTQALCWKGFYTLAVFCAIICKLKIDDFHKLFIDEVKVSKPLL